MANGKNGKTGRSNHKRRGITIPMAIMMPIAATGGKAYDVAKTRGVSKVPEALTAWYTGIDLGDNSRFKWEHLRSGLYPLAVGAAIHRLIGVGLGVNKALGSARVPFLRL